MTRLRQQPLAFRQRTLARAIAISLSLLPLAALLPHAAAAREQSAALNATRERRIDFDIPAQELTTALNAFAAQAGAQVLTYHPVMAGKRSPAVRGKYTEAEVLSLLLRDSGLQYIVSGKHKQRRTYAFKLQALADAMDPSALRSRRAEAHAQADTDGSDGRREIGQLGDQVVDARRRPASRLPVGQKSYSIDREDIERSPYLTLAEVVGALPQNFEGGATEDTTIGREALSNAASGTALNLRALDAGATIPLLDGRRLAPGGTEGTFTDISTLPTSVIERIDIVPDGASITHGPDAIGGTVNLITRKGLDGAETQLRSGLATDGGATETLASQVVGAYWESGSGLAAYEFYERDALHAEDREFTARSDLSALGGDNFDSFLSNPGNVRVGNQVFAIPSGQDGTALTPGDFVAGTINLRNRNLGIDVLPQQRRHSMFGTLTQELGEDVLLFAEALYSQRDAEFSRGGFATTLTIPESNAFYVHPTAGSGPVQVHYDFGDDVGARLVTTSQKVYNAALGATVDLNDDWKLTLQVGSAGERLTQLTGNLIDPLALAVALADPDSATAFNPFGDGSHTNPVTLATLPASTHFAMESELSFAQLTLDGVLMHVADREIRLTLGAEGRQHTFDSDTDAQAFGFPITSNSYSRDVNSVFAELLIPLVPSPRSESCCGRLDLSVAARAESYSDAGSSVSPKFGLEWSPLEGITLRGTYSNSYKAPNLIDLDEINNGSIIFPIPDPLSPTGASDVLLWFGKNRDLREETARTWTLGVSFAPDALPGTRIGATLFDIEFDQRVREVPPVITFLADPTFQDIVTRDPTAAQRAEVCSRSTFFSGPPDDCLNAPVSAIVDGRITNTATTRTRGIDVFMAHEMPSAIGTFTAALDATRVLRFEEAWGQGASVSMLDTQHNPLALRGRASLTWEHRGYGAALEMRHAGSYDDVASEPQRKVDSWTTFNLWMGYEIAADYPGFLANTAFSVNVQNIFDEDPPFLNNPRGMGYDEENANPTGRFVGFRISKKW